MLSQSAIRTVTPFAGGWAICCPCKHLPGGVLSHGPALPPIGQEPSALALAANAVKNEAALLLTRQLGVSYKTAWVLLMKLRETIASERVHMALEGTVEIDGTYIGGYVKPENRAEDRKDRRLAENRSSNADAFLPCVSAREGPLRRSRSQKTPKPL